MTTNRFPDEGHGGVGERRNTRREAIVSERARLAHRDGISRFRSAPARLIDISEKGACVVSAAPAPRDEFVWVGLEDLPLEWVKATIQAVNAVAEGWAFHLAFHEPCPAGLLELAIDGTPPVAAEVPFSLSFELS